MKGIAAHLDLDERVLGVLLGVLCGLVVGSLVRLAWREGDADRRGEQLRSLATWWVLVSLLFATVVWRPVAAAIVFATTSLLGLREYIVMTGSKYGHDRGHWIPYVAVLVRYGLILLDHDTPYAAGIGLAFVLAVAAHSALSGMTEGFVGHVASMSYGMLLIVFGLSHLVLLLTLDDGRLGPTGAVGLFVYLLILTQLNDIAQALWGRSFGRRRVTPRVSPNKTWEGLILGVATTVLAAVALAPFLTPLFESPTNQEGATSVTPYLWALLLGGEIAVAGFLGDINMSAVKRDCGVKDSGTLLPGQGGVLDRVDSLTFTAPVFYYTMVALYGR